MARRTLHEASLQGGVNLARARGSYSGDAAGFQVWPEALFMQGNSSCRVGHGSRVGVCGGDTQSEAGMRMDCEDALFVQECGWCANLRSQGPPLVKWRRGQDSNLRSL